MDSVWLDSESFPVWASGRSSVSTRKRSKTERNVWHPSESQWKEAKLNDLWFDLSSSSIAEPQSSDWLCLPVFSEAIDSVLT